MELVEKNILPVESSLKEAIIGEARGGSVWRALPMVSVISYRFACLLKGAQSHHCSYFPISEPFSPHILQNRMPSGTDSSREMLNCVVDIKLRV